MSTLPDVGPHQSVSPADLVYHEGRYVDKHELLYGAESRAVLFADGVYEVVRYEAGRAYRLQDHLDRLGLSLQALDLEADRVVACLPGVMDQLLACNGLREARVYVQAVRPGGARDFLASLGVEPVLTAMAYPLGSIVDEREVPVVSALVVEDVRWSQCDVKSLMLMPASLAKSRARRGGRMRRFLSGPSRAGLHVTSPKGPRRMCVWCTKGGCGRIQPTGGCCLE